MVATFQQTPGARAAVQEQQAWIAFTQKLAFPVNTLNATRDPPRRGVGDGTNPDGFTDKNLPLGVQQFVKSSQYQHGMALKVQPRQGNDKAPHIFTVFPKRGGLRYAVGETPDSGYSLNQDLGVAPGKPVNSAMINQLFQNKHPKYQLVTPPAIRARI